MNGTVAPAAADRTRDLAGYEGETTQATILFVDVVGSLELSASVSPQEWWALMHGVMGVTSDVVHDEGGWVERFTGDGIKAVFGAPLDREGHAVQACAAALRLRRDLVGRYGLAVRIGLHTGEVVTGLVGSGLSMQYTAMGHTAALAKRIEAIAGPWAICMTADTASLVSGRFEVDALGAFAIKGIRDPVPVFALRG